MTDSEPQVGNSSERRAIITGKERRCLRASLLRSFSLPMGLAMVLGTPLIVGCNSETKPQELAPKSAELKAAPAASLAQTFKVNTQKSLITFRMNAEKEEITGRAPQSASGTLSVDPRDIEKTQGLVKIDLLELSIYHRKRDNADDDFGEEVMSEKQNEHMQTWLQIAGDGPKEELAKNRYAEFKITGVVAKGASDLTQLSGERRSVDIEVSGSLRLHGRVTKHSFPAEAEFVFAGDTPASVQVRAHEPISVHLEKHDVKPRSAFNILADKTLDALGAKVAKVAKIQLMINAQQE